MRKHILNAKRSLFLCAIMVVLGCSSSAFAGATIQIVNLDGPNEGFNDPTPASPVGGNAGTTLGQQRLIAFQHAADIWGATLDSNQVIRIQAAFNPLAPNVLGSAGATSVFRDFGGVGAYPGAEFPGTWYGAALADKRAGADLNPAINDINAQFSSNFNFYLGLDNNHGAQPDLVVVLLHEFAHGLNFQTFVNASTGANFGGFTDIYARYLLDTTTGVHWYHMTQAERQAAATKFGRIVWDGATVTANVPNVLVFGSPEVRVNTPPAIAGSYQFGTAAFGPALGSPNVTADILAAVDAVEPGPPAPGGTSTDGCSAFTNAAQIAGKIALIERGFCGFALKARNATDAGAAGVIIYNNAANAGGAPPGMADDGTNGAFVTIPTVSLTRADGLAIVGQLGTGVNGSLLVDPTIRAGADALGRARVYAPFPVSGGSSISHYDTVANRNLLMEPAINANLTHNVQSPDDLTLELFRDVGWFPDADVDGVADGVDNCVNTPNGDQANNDGDAEGDACDPDDDNDGVLDGADNCPFTANTDQANNDGDAEGDACDADDDNDTVLDGADNCPFTANTDQADADLDGIGNACEAPADLRLDKLALPTAHTGGFMAYVIVARNAGPNTAANVVVTDALPAGTTFMSAFTSKGSCTQAGGIVTCNVGTLSKNHFVGIALVVRVNAPAGTVLVNTANVAGAHPDPNPGNNTDTASTRVVGRRPWFNHQ